MTLRLNKSTIIISAVLAAMAVAAGYLVSLVSGPTNPLNFVSNVDAFWTRFYYMFAVAVLIERSVEVYLQVTDLDGDEENSAARAATTAALVLAAMLAIIGLRIVETLITLTPLATSVGGAANAVVNPFAATLFFGVDVLVSAGLMAGGAVVFHPLIQSMTNILEAMKLRSGAQLALLNVGAGVVVPEKRVTPAVPVTSVVVTPEAPGNTP